MRLAWFRATPPDSNALHDRTAPLIAGLRRLHTIDIVTAAEAHDFVWKDARQPYDLCIFEVGDSPAHRFVQPYALHYPGVAVFTGSMAPDVRLWRGSRVVVVADAAIARMLSSVWPGARLRVAQLASDLKALVGSDPVAAWGSDPAGSPVYGPRPAVVHGEDDAAMFAPVSRATGTADRAPGTGDRVAPPHRGLTFGLLDPARRAVVDRAVARARQRGAAVTVIEGPTVAVLREAHVIVALEWPPTGGPPVAALHGMAASRPVIALEVEATAGWPAWDPQTWQPRGFSLDQPIAILLDPRDEEHSLLLAIVRLAADAPLRSNLASAGHAWWQAHATVDRAVAAWEAILGEAVTLGSAAPQVLADGSDRAREILGELGVRVDVFHS
jgi:hypothetical protein